MRDVLGRFIKGHNYKGGRPKCPDCGKILSDYRAKYCHPCSMIHAVRKDTSGDKNHFFGKKHTDETRNKISCKVSGRYGKMSSHWKGGITPIARIIRELPEMYEWRTSVFERDSYTCLQCLDSSGSNLQAHHEKEFKHLLSDFLSTYSQFSPAEDRETLVRLAISYKPFWDIGNGRTLCKKCHESKSPGRPGRKEDKCAL